MNDYAVSTFIWLWQKVCERAHVSDRVCVCHVLAVTATATNIIGGDFDGNGGGDGDSKNHQNQFQSLKAPKKTEFQRSPSPTVYVLCWRKQTNSRRHRAPLMECGRPNFKLIHFEWNTKLYIYISTLAINFNFPFLIPKLKCISMRPRPYCFRGDFIPIYVSLSSIELTTVVCVCVCVVLLEHQQQHILLATNIFLLGSAVVIILLNELNVVWIQLDCVQCVRVHARLWIRSEKKLIAQNKKKTNSERLHTYFRFDFSWHMGEVTYLNKKKQKPIWPKRSNLNRVTNTTLLSDLLSIEARCFPSQKTKVWSIHSAHFQLHLTHFRQIFLLSLLLSVAFIDRRLRRPITLHGTHLHGGYPNIVVFVVCIRCNIITTLKPELHLTLERTLAIQVLCINVCLMVIQSNVLYWQC